MSNKFRFDQLSSTIRIYTMSRRPRKPRGPRPPRQKKERALAGTGSIVTNFRQASRSNLKGATLHQTRRNPDGWSAIDPERAHLNEVWVGTDMHILNDINTYMREVIEPTHKNSSGSPFCTIILGASPEYFRPDGGEPGDEDTDRLNAWKKLTKIWIAETFGDDLVSAIYNGDETTPHVHLAICPTYMKMPRKPDGRKKKGETEEAYDQRVCAWKASEGEKTLSWSSNAVLGQYNSFGQLREGYAEAMKPLGLEYSLASFEPEEYPEPKHKKEHVAEVEKQCQEELAQLQKERRLLAEEREVLRLEHEAFNAAKDEVIATALEEGTANAIRISKATVAAGEKVAASIEVNAKAKAEKLEAERTTEWEERFAELVKREQQAKKERVRLKDEMSWISNAIENISYALEAVFSGTFSTVQNRDIFPKSTATDALFAGREDKPDEADRFEFLSTHFSNGEPIPLPSGLKLVIVNTFSQIREFALNFITQQKEARDLRQETRDLGQARKIANNKVSNALEKLMAARKEHEDAVRDLQLATEHHGKLTMEIDQYSQKLKLLRPAYDELQNWLNEISNIKPDDRDFAEAHKWMQSWKGRGFIMDHAPYEIAAHLQDNSYRAAFCDEAAIAGIDCDLSSPDIRARWRQIKGVTDENLKSLVAVKDNLDASMTQPRLSKTDMENALAIEIAKNRSKEINRIPPLAKQFLDLPKEVQATTKKVFRKDASSRHNM